MLAAAFEAQRRKAGQPDTEFPDNWLVGGSVRAHFTPRLALEPEVLYMRAIPRKAGNEIERVSVLPLLVYQFHATSARVYPYVTGGAGYSRERQKVGGTWVEKDQLTAQGGVGAKVFASRRVYVGMEVRGGVHPFVQMSVGLGFVLN